VTGYLKEHPDEQVYFVTRNSKDFGTGASYPDPMLSDLGGMEDRLTILASFDGIVSRFTEEIPVDTGHVTSLLAGLPDDALAPAGSFAQASMKDGRFAGTRFGPGGTFEPWSWENWFLPPAAIARNVNAAAGHKIGSSEWYTATAEWILVGYAQPADVRALYADGDAAPGRRDAGHAGPGADGMYVAGQGPV
jgi:hypothetical protein